MKKIIYMLGLFLTLAFFASCEEKNYEFGDIVSPSDIQIDVVIVGADDANPFGDGSGEVRFSATAKNAITYKYTYGDSQSMQPDGNKTIFFGKTGTFKYTVTVEAYGTGGVSSSKSIEVEVFAVYAPPADLLEMLHGDSEKTWRLKAETAAHLGVGPSDGLVPIWWAAAPFEKDEVGAYDDRFIFNSDGTFTHVTNGNTFGKLDPMSIDLDGDQGLTADANGEVDNYVWNDYSESWSLSAPGGQETLTFSNIGYHGFYVGGDHSYQILERNATDMSLRTIGADGNAWYAILTTLDPPDTDTLELVWSDEFDTDGAPDSAKWTYDLGAGGWGNGEEQSYTSNAENVVVSNGNLIITAMADGNSYTSARIKTQGIYSFKYGRIEISAKLPNAQGTWPAIWMLGSDFDTVGWPRCGEIDIMESVGDWKAGVLGTFHWWNTAGSANASYGDRMDVANISTEFHVYSLEWTEDALEIFVDDVKLVEIANNADLPFFDKEFFMILNLAMGGTLGNTIDPNFTEDTMEIDYIRVYQ